jgi:hypothetical protein
VQPALSIPQPLQAQGLSKYEMKTGDSLGFIPNTKAKLDKDFFITDSTENFTLWTGYLKTKFT